MSQITWKKVLKLVPMIILGLMIVYTWATFISAAESLYWKYWLALGLFVANVVFYFFRFNLGVISTGILLLAGIFVLVQFTPVTFEQDFSWYVGKFELSTPYMEMRILFLFVVYLVLNRPWKLLPKL